jgi:hypothetical protein
MKKLIFPIVIAAMLSSCGNSNDPKDNADSAKKDSVTMQFFGDTINSDGAVAATEIASRIKGKDSIAIKLEGKILDVCQRQGCWMALDLGNNNSMRVTFKDYAFFVPKDCGGKTAVVDGYAYVDTTSVAELKHYAEDGGASADSLAKITEPKVEMSFEARGVIIR